MPTKKPRVKAQANGQPTETQAERHRRVIVAGVKKLCGVDISDRLGDREIAAYHKCSAQEKTALISTTAAQISSSLGRR